jgi:hypothetical protein
MDRATPSTGQAFARRTRSPVGDRAAEEGRSLTLGRRTGVGSASSHGGTQRPPCHPPAPRGRAVSAFAKAMADKYAWMSMRPCDATHRFSRRRSSAFARRLRRTCPRCAQGTNAPSSAEAMEGFAGGFREAPLEAPHAELGMIRQSGPKGRDAFVDTLSRINVADPASSSFAHSASRNASQSRGLRRTTPCPATGPGKRMSPSYSLKFYRRLSVQSRENYK